MSSLKNNALIIYDGDCLFCQNYVRLIRLRKAVGNVDLINIRSDDPRVAQYWEQGYDLNEGMIFVYANQVFYGYEAVNVLAGLTTPSSILNRINWLLFSSATALQVLYPLLRAGRAAMLYVRNQKIIRIRLNRSGHRFINLILIVPHQYRLHRRAYPCLL